MSLRSCFRNVFSDGIFIPNSTIKLLFTYLRLNTLSMMFRVLQTERGSSGEERSAHSDRNNAMCISLKTVSRRSFEYIKYRTLKDLNARLYKVRTQQELKPADCLKHLAYCDWMLHYRHNNMNIRNEVFITLMKRGYTNGVMKILRIIVYDPLQINMRFEKTVCIQKR